jgi:hypothetical protein
MGAAQSTGTVRIIMTDPIVRFDRKFQLWLYSVSHGQLLLRSTKNQNYQTQVDVLFKNVAIIQLPVVFAGLAISEISQQEFRLFELSACLLDVHERRCFKLEGENWDGFIVAGHVSWLENDSEHSAESELLS